MEAKKITTQSSPTTGCSDSFSQSYSNQRIDDSGHSNAKDGKLVLSLNKLFWLASVFLVSIVGGWLTFSIEALLVLLVTTGVSLCLGHSLGMHRKLIHQSFNCPLWLESVSSSWGYRRFSGTDWYDQDS